MINELPYNICKCGSVLRVPFGVVLFSVAKVTHPFVISCSFIKVSTLSQ